MEKWQKLLLGWSVPHTSFFSVDAVVRVELLSKTLAEQHMATLLPNFCLLSVGKELKAFSQTLQGWTFSLSCALSPQNDSIQQQQEFPQHLQIQVTADDHLSLYMLLKAEPSLEGYVADGKADLSACLQLRPILDLQYFWGTYPQVPK